MDYIHKKMVYILLTLIILLKRARVCACLTCIRLVLFRQSVNLSKIEITWLSRWYFSLVY